MNHAQPKGRRKPPLGGLNASTIFPLLPESGVPLFQLLASYLSVAHRRTDIHYTGNPRIVAAGFDSSLLCLRYGYYLHNVVRSDGDLLLGP